MRILLFIIAAFLSSPVLAQIPAPSMPDGEILPKPICSALVNRSDVSILGSIVTQKQTIADGTKVAHRDNFKILAGQRKEFCVSGPFFEGRRVEIVLRTVVPLFSCKTKLDKEIFLDSEAVAEGTRKLSATCY